MAKKKKNDLLSKKEKEHILKKSCYEVIKDISEISHKAIDDFYRDYTPEFYQRTWGLKNLFSPKFRIANNKEGAVVIFTYSSENITTEHRANNKDVFYYNFIRGYHGGEYIGYNDKFKNPNIMKPSPWNYIYRYVDQKYPLIKKNVSKNKAKKR